jgi:hypothetical protein
MKLKTKTNIMTTTVKTNEVLKLEKQNYYFKLIELKMLK